MRIAIRSSLLLFVTLVACSSTAIREPFASMKPEDTFRIVGSTQPKLGDVVDTKIVGATPSPSSACGEAFDATWSPKVEPLSSPEVFLKFTTSEEAAGSFGGTYKLITGNLDLHRENKYAVELSVIERARLDRKAGSEDEFAYCCSVVAGNCAGNAYVSELGRLRVHVTEYEKVDGGLKGGEKYLAEGNTTYRRTTSYDSDRVFYYARFSELPAVDPIGARDLTVNGPSYFDIMGGAKGTVLPGDIKVSLSAKRRHAEWSLSFTSTAVGFGHQRPNKPETSSTLTGSCVRKKNTWDCSSPAVQLVILSDIQDSQQTQIKVIIRDKYAGAPVDGPRIDLFLYRQIPRASLKLTAAAEPAVIDFDDRSGAIVARSLKITPAAPDLAQGDFINISVLEQPPGITVKGPGPCTTPTCPLEVTFDPKVPRKSDVAQVLLGVSRSNLGGLVWPIKVGLKLPVPPPPATGGPVSAPTALLGPDGGYEWLARR
jgi:hypothetical protein